MKTAYFPSRNCDVLDPFQPHIYYTGKMQCEVCEKLIVKGKKVRIEGSVVVTCDECAKYGEVVDSADSSRDKKGPAPAKKKKNVRFDVVSEELVDEYADKIRRRREKRGLKQEELAQKINEPASLIHRIEIGKIEPSLRVARKLERFLGMKLIHKSESEDFEDQKTKGSDDLTLGDLVVIKKKKK